MYDHYVAVDWAQSNMAITRMTVKSNKITAIDVHAGEQLISITLNRFCFVLIFNEVSSFQSDKMRTFNYKVNVDREI